MVCLLVVVDDVCLLVVVSCFVFVFFRLVLCVCCLLCVGSCLWFVACLLFACCLLLLFSSLSVAV